MRRVHRSQRCCGLTARTPPLFRAQCRKPRVATLRSRSRWSICGPICTSALREAEPAVAGDWADAALAVARIGAEATALNQDRAQTLAAALQAVALRVSLGA